jgi:DNA mismatch repair protein MLH1
LFNYFSLVTFRSCKKQGASSPDLHTQPGASRLDNIRVSFGAAVAKELLSFQGDLPRLDCQYSGICSNANYNMKKLVLILFINHRLVECTPLRSAIDSVYATYLPKHTHPFVYLSLQVCILVF